MARTVYFKMTLLLLPAGILGVLGCATTRTSDTPRTAIEQLLISSAVDQALAKIDFSPIQGRAVFVQEKYLDGIDKNYVAASVRHRVLAAGGRLVDKDADADVIMEVRSGGIGTDRAESFIGVPQVAVPGALPVQIPEVQLVTNKKQSSTAKIGIVAYDAKTRQAIGAGGHSLARSEDNNWFFLGAGPFNSGNVREEVRTATGRSDTPFELVRLIPLLPHEPKEQEVAPVEFAPPETEFAPYQFPPGPNTQGPHLEGPDASRGPSPIPPAQPWPADGAVR